MDPVVAEWCTWVDRPVSALFNLLVPTLSLVPPGPDDGPAVAAAVPPPDIRLKLPVSMLMPAGQLAGVL